MESKSRDISIDFLKIIAVFFILNSHSDCMYAKFGSLATGGAIGDALFLFCSGFTLWMRPISSSFANWYKKRINRIYPTVFAWTFLSALFFHASSDIKEFLLWGGVLPTLNLDFSSKANKIVPG